MWHRLDSLRRSHARRLAIETDGRAMGFEEMFQLADELDVLLQRAGVRDGAAVALALPNGLTFVPALLALWKRGCAVGLVSPRYSISELGSIANGIQLDGWITTTSHAEKLRTALGAPPATRVDIGLPGEPLALVRPEAPGGAPNSPLLAGAALLKFTSGSTGQPKCIALSAENVAAEAQNVVETLELTAADRILADVPMFHSYGFDLGVLAMLFSGASLTLQDFFVPHRIGDDLARRNISIFLGVPNMYRRWIEAAAPVTAPIASVRYLLSCTAPLDATTIREFSERFHMPLCQHYGSSETGAVTNHVPGQVLERSESVGLPMRNVHVRVLDPDGKQLPAGVEGEIVVQSAALARGYAMGAPADRQPFRDGAYWTGDLAVVDPEGFVFLHGRVDQLINVGGLKVAPEEVRRVLERHPAVREAGVLGVPDGNGETMVAAVVALRGTVTEKELTAYCYGQLADYKVPRRIAIRGELPRGPAGKVRLRPEDLDG